MLVETCLIAVSALWVAFEITLLVMRRSDPTAKRHDAGTLKALNLIIYLAVASALVLSATGHGLIAVPLALLWAGLAIIVAGLALRLWAVLCLRQFFTVDVAIQKDHRLVQTGPYRCLRHPAYSGSLLSFAGLALCTSSWLSALIILIPITCVFLYRVHVEERVLNEAFPQEYREYSQQRARLIPGVY
jgi:protein-S-isoprenylcysteine O-methyltransferase